MTTGVVEELQNLAHGALSTEFGRMVPDRSVSEHNSPSSRATQWPKWRTSLAVPAR